MITALPLPAELPLTGDRSLTRWTVRRPTGVDVPALMALLAEDVLAAGRGDTDAPEALAEYRAAMDAVVADPSNEMMVAVDGMTASPRSCSSRASPGSPGAARRDCS